VKQVSPVAPQPLPRPSTNPKPLGESLGQIGVVRLIGSRSVDTESIGDLMITGVTHDSTRVHPGDAFFALPGTSTHGAQFASQVANGGAVVIVTDDIGAEVIAAELGPALPVIVCKAPWESLGVFANWLYDYPSKSLKVVGITGTNGKTTTAWLVAAAATRAGLKAASLGTTGVQFGESAWAHHGLTTPEAGDLQAALAFLVEAGAEVVAMEVSSHALALGRVAGTHFATVGFTGLSQDHLDFHGDMDSYFATKATLFTTDFASNAVIVLDDWGAKLSALTSLTYETVGLPGSSADWVLTAFDATPAGMEFDFTTPEQQKMHASIAIWGEFNCMNSVLAVALANQIGIPPKLSASALSDVAVPGRMQTINHSSGVIGVVDYAHTPDAIKRSIEAVRANRPATRLIVVVGAGGNRDSAKRPAMGKAAGLADVVFITDDNPRFESPADIRAALLSGLAETRKSVDSSEVFEVADRAAAILAAVRAARSGDVVMVLGKGHENGQEVAGVVAPFDDLIILRKALDARDSAKGSIGVAS
jgi:UDP-N-acetylmuramoyl-L-alanyl-D-glutamate--2,6-diaminopimelate ligase